METILKLIDQYGGSALGWIVALGILYVAGNVLNRLVSSLVKKLGDNFDKLTENVTELTTISKVQQEQISGLTEDVRDLKAAVFIVNYPKSKK